MKGVGGGGFGANLIVSGGVSITNYGVQGDALPLLGHEGNEDLIKLSRGREVDDYHLIVSRS